MKKEYPSPPKGTYGLAIAPWTPGEVYAVAADWGDAQATVWAYGDRGWRRTSYQVADWRYSPRAALAHELAMELRACGLDPQEADQEAAELVEDAVVIPGGQEVSG